MEALSFIISVLSVALSIWALFKANSAKKEVNKVVRRSERDEDRIRIKKLIDILRKAASAASANTGSSPNYRQGVRRDIAADLEALKMAESALRTDFPLAAASAAEAKAHAAANEIGKCIKGISKPDTERDWWRDAQLAIEASVRDCEKLENTLKGNVLSGE